MLFMVIKEFFQILYFLQSINMKLKIAFFLLFSPLVLFGQFDVDSVLSFAQNVQKTNNERADAFLEVADFYYNTKDELDSTILFGQKAYELTQDSDQKAKSLYLQGGANALRANYELASEQLFAAFRFLENSEEKMLKALTIKEIGYVFLYTGNREKAVEWFQKMYDIFIEIGDKEKAAYTLGSIGTVYHSDSNNVEAIKYFEQGLELADELNDEGVYKFLYSNIGLAYFYNGQQKKGEDYLIKSLKINEKLGAKYNIGINLANLTHFAEMQGEFDKSLRYGLRALPILKELDLKNPLRVVLRNLSAVYEKKGNLKEALKYKDEYYQLKAEIDAENSKKEAEIQELEYDAEKDQLEIENLNKDIENRRLQQVLLFGGILVLLGIGGVLWWTNKSLNKKNTLIAEQKTEIEAFNKDLEQKVADRTAELQTALDEIKEAMAKGQTLERKRIASDLHDNLGSVISAINFSLSGINPENLGEKQKDIYSNVVQMTDAAYSELRNLSHNLLPEKLEKEGLVEATRQYLDTLNAAQPVWFDFTSNTQERFSKKVEVNLYAIIMECCNNILKHAKATDAEIVFETAGDVLNVHIKDNGIGIETNTLSDGNGLANIKERIYSVNGNVEVKSTGDGTNYHMVISEYK